MPPFAAWTGAEVRLLPLRCSPSCSCYRACQCDTGPGSGPVPGPGNVLATASSEQQVSAILFLGSRVTMDELYPVAKSLPMTERRAYVVRTLQARFAEMSSQLMPAARTASKTGELTHVRPLWIINAVRVTATARFDRSLAAGFPEVEFMDSDRPHRNTLDAIGWGLHEIQADRVWQQYRSGPAPVS